MSVRTVTAAIPVTAALLAMIATKAASSPQAASPTQAASPQQAASTPQAASPTQAASPPQAASPQPPADVTAAIAPFSAHYQADWKGISVGTSDLDLEQDTEPQHYVYTWTITARGIFRLYRSEVTQKSWLSINAEHVRPDKYRAEDGTSRVDLDFDWVGYHARGTSEDKPVDLTLKDGIQDVMSIQIEVMLDLKKGNLPKTFMIIDKDELKEFIYTQEGTATIRTDLGPLDTIVVASQRAGNNRILRMWFAPSLGFVPVQAERTRDGKPELAMRIKSLKRQSR
jgi:hypothetical protein